MASVSVGAEGFIRKAAGGRSVTGGGADARPGRKPEEGVAGKRRPVDEYIASLPAQAAFIGGKTLETLPSLPQPQQNKGPGGNAARSGIGFNAAGWTGIGLGSGTGIDSSGGGVNTVGMGGGTVDTAAGMIGADEDADTEEADETDEKDGAEEEADGGGKASDAELSAEELAAVSELRNRDREVRAHEQAHVSAGGAYISGGISYQYQRGPDNRSYAVGGEVGIDTAPESDNPGATITKMQTVRAAALAPNDPSAQDRAVAAAAARNESIARADLAAEERNDGG